ncbi:MAG TPA: hypothetical protein VFF65_06375 [Phycisphaerales bacterium]|nr:hypothetical protein [Phycisphaerales bacterium]
MPLTIDARSLGSRKALFEGWSVPPPADLSGDDGFTLRHLIAHVVRHEVDAFRRRSEARRLDRVLSARQIDAQAAAGRVAPEGRRVSADVNEDGAIGAALQAFEDGLYLVVIDGQEHRELDRQVFLKEDSRLTFVRLTLLAGA